MISLTEQLNVFLEDVRKKQQDLDERFVINLDMKLNPEFTEESAKRAVAGMQNEDGSCGEHWDWDSAVNLMKRHGYGFKPCDFYYTLNMMYSDYFDSQFEEEWYCKMAAKFLSDKDAPKHKAKLYYKAMHKGEEA